MCLLVGTTYSISSLALPSGGWWKEVLPALPCFSGLVVEKHLWENWYPVPPQPNSGPGGEYFPSVEESSDSWLVLYLSL